MARPPFLPADLGGYGPSWGNLKGEAEYDVWRYRAMGSMPPLPAPQINQQQSNQTRAQQVQARNLFGQAGQGNTADMRYLYGAATGAPTRATALGEEMRDRTLASNLSAAGNVRGGPAAQAAAYRSVTQGAAQQRAALNQGIEAERAAEMEQARGDLARGMGSARRGAFGAATATRGQDISSAVDQANLDLQEREAQRQQQRFYEQMGINTRFAALEGAQRNQGIDTGRQLDQARLAREQRAADYGQFKSVVGAAAGAAEGAGAFAAQQREEEDAEARERRRRYSYSDERAKYVYSDDRTKLAAAWDEGHAAATADVAKLAKMPPDKLKALSETNPTARAVREAMGGAWDTGRGAAAKDVATYARMPEAQLRQLAETDDTARAVREAQREQWELGHEAGRTAPPPEAELTLPEGFVGGPSPNPLPPPKLPPVENFQKPPRPRPVTMGTRTVSSGRKRDTTRSDERTKDGKWEVLPLDDASDGRQLRQDDAGAFYEAAPTDDDGRPSLSGSGRPKHLAQRAAPPSKSKEAAPKYKPRKKTPEELMREAEALEREMRGEHEARMRQGPAVGPKDEAMANAARSMEAQPYSYKPQFRPPEQKPGEVNIGPMANNMARDPVARTAIVKEPETGMLAIDKDKGLKVVMGSLASLQRQIDALSKRRAA